MDKPIIQKALKYYGERHQIKKTVEELTELSLALQHFLDGKATVDEVVTELADVDIMVCQIVEVFGVDKFFSERLVKVERLNNRINEAMGI